MAVAPENKGHNNKHPPLTLFFLLDVVRRRWLLDGIPLWSGWVLCLGDGPSQDFARHLCTGEGESWRHSLNAVGNINSSSARPSTSYCVSLWTFVLCLDEVTCSLFTSFALFLPCVQRRWEIWQLKNWVCLSGDETFSVILNVFFFWKRKEHTLMCCWGKMVGEEKNELTLGIFSLSEAFYWSLL